MPAWTDATERQLLFCVISAASITSANYDQIAIMMGGGYTAEAVKQKFNKMKRAGKEEFGDMGEVAKGSAPKGKARGAKAATPKKVGGKRKGKQESEAEAERSEAGDDEESPSKKVKVKAEAKEECEGEDEDAF